MRLDGKIALITGAGSGIGRELAIEAANRGLVQYLVGRRSSKLEQTRRRLKPGAVAHCVEADITAAEGRLAIRNAVERGGHGLDILVNNAGCISNRPFLESADADVARMVDTNLMAPILLTRDLLPFLQRSGGARIVNIGSIYGDIATPGFAVYAATKFALRGLSDALRHELAADGIGVTYAAPRATQTEGIERISAALKRQGVVLDDPAPVARWIWSAVERERRSAYPPTVERLFVGIQRILPALIDRALGGKRRDRQSHGASPTESDPEWTAAPTAERPYTKSR